MAAIHLLASAKHAISASWADDRDRFLTTHHLIRTPAESAVDDRGGESGHLRGADVNQVKGDSP